MIDVTEVPVNDRLLAMEKSIERQKAIFSVHKDFTLALNRLSDASVKEVSALIARDKLKAYADFKNEMRAKFVEIPVTFKATNEGMKEEQDYRRNLVAKSQQFVEGLGVDKKKVEGIFKEYIKKSGATFDQYLRPKEAAYVVSNPAQVPKITHNPWTWRYPPYDEEYSMKWLNGTNGTYWATTSENRYTGQIGAQSRIYIHSHRDSDYISTDTMSEIWVWYKMPAAGMVEAWLFLQNIYGNYDGSMDDLWGWSDIDVKQQSWAYMDVFYPAGGARYESLLDFQEGEHDCSWSGKVSNANPGDFRYPHLFSTQAYPANQWVLIAFGIRDYNYAWVNDYQADLSMTNRWFMKNLTIRSTGAP